MAAARARREPQPVPPRPARGGPLRRLEPALAPIVRQQRSRGTAAMFRQRHRAGAAARLPPLPAVGSAGGYVYYRASSGAGSAPPRHCGALTAGGESRCPVMDRTIDRSLSAASGFRCARCCGRSWRSMTCGIRYRFNSLPSQSAAATPFMIFMLLAGVVYQYSTRVCIRVVQVPGARSLWEGPCPPPANRTAGQPGPSSSRTAVKEQSDTIGDLGASAAHRRGVCASSGSGAGRR